MVTSLFLAIILLVVLGYVLGKNRADVLSTQGSSKMHSLPGYHGVFIAAWVGIPAFLLVLIWLLFQGSVIDNMLVSALPAEKTEGLSPGQLQIIISEIKSVAAGHIFGEPAAYIVEAANRYNEWYSLSRWAMVVVTLTLGVLALTLARGRISRSFRARHNVEKVLDGIMIVCSMAAILTTLGIVLSLTFEAFRFFAKVPLSEFLFGTNWEPQIPIREDQVTNGGAFGAIPVFAGTLQIALLAMLVATPIGLLAAIYLTEYASDRFRAIIKPILEILAGIPTVVYGFFAVLVVAPSLRSFGQGLGFDIAPNSALAAGAVMGIMLIPFISSFSDDAISAVPDSLRDGSYGLGATKGETILNVLLPAALPGIMAGVLLALSRAIGETMIVVMAAGIIANMTANPFEPVTTVTVQIVTLLIGDSEFDNPKTLAAFALGLVLFIVTLLLNVLSQFIVNKYRERYD